MNALTKEQRGHEELSTFIERLETLEGFLCIVDKAVKDWNSGEYDNDDFLKTLDDACAKVTLPSIKSIKV